MIDKKHIEWLKKTFPFIFSRVVKSKILVRIVLELDRLRYWTCLLSKRPYFGSILLAGQTWESRKKWMKRLIAVESHKLRKGKSNF